ncbi:hypothetical protein SK128_000689 [Halocaridina rubra]|uniref:C2H2-type domain-containing protein n=1 Tax=Halocaridina rubra TaxID=373956 RepID=A0AAN9ACN9_HALRR
MLRISTRKMSMRNWTFTEELECESDCRKLGGFNSQFPPSPYPQFKESGVSRQAQTSAPQKPFICPQCPYRTGFKGNLVKHIRIHTGEKPYSCPLCQYATSFKNNLNRHILTHQPAN